MEGPHLRPFFFELMKRPRANVHSVFGGLGLLLAWLIYLPGLTGSYHFDDFANLPVLGAMGAVDNADALWRYLTAGHADPTGRPIALLSFLLDANDWPADPRPFLRTNILLHLLNGALLACLILRMQAQRAFVDARVSDNAAHLAAVLAALVWLLHPLFVSTTLYIVQREAMLPATFILLGLLGWLHGRKLMAEGRHRMGLAWISTALIGCTGLALLSKANGALLPALALVVEATALRGTAPRVAVYRTAMRVLAWLPTLVLGAYLLHAGWLGVTRGISDARPWTLGERLLTQPRVLMDYLGLIWLPRPFTSGLFNDQFEASTSLLAPATTLAALVAVSILLVGAYALRRRFPLAALSILFFFVSHAIESTTVALELYFEHRNYVPAMLMFWPLATWLCGTTVVTQTNRTPLAPRRILAILLVLGLAIMTYARAELWGNTRDQALLWAELNPTSSRAQAHAANFETTNGMPERAVRRLTTALSARPDDVQLALGMISARCAIGELEDHTLDSAAKALATTRDVGGLLTSWFGRAIAAGPRLSCPQLDLDALELLVSAAEHNPHLRRRPGRRQDLLHLHGRIALAREQPAAALTRFDQALVEQVRIGFALEQAALLGAAGHPDLGLRHLDAYERLKSREYRPPMGMPRLHAWVLRRQGYWTHELSRLRSTLQHDARTKAKAMAVAQQ